MLDQPASSKAFWAIKDATGIRPEWLIPVLAYESSLNPAIPNSQGYPYYGINQISGTWLAASGIDPADYLSWPASRQLTQVVLPYFQAQVNTYGPLNSGIRVYQAEFYPASLKTSRWLTSAIVSSPSQAYEANAGFDTAHMGFITTADLGSAISKMLTHPYVKQAIDDAYAQRPLEWLLRSSSVYGYLPHTIALGGGMLAYGLTLKYNPKALPPWARLK